MQKIIRRLEVEKEELHKALDESEAALEAEESKVLRAQIEVSQIRSEIEKRISEKEESFEQTRKNHQRALEVSVNRHLMFPLLALTCLEHASNPRERDQGQDGGSTHQEEARIGHQRSRDRAWLGSTD